jgi:hypothetical protein
MSASVTAGVTGVTGVVVVGVELPPQPAINVAAAADPAPAINARRDKALSIRSFSLFSTVYLSSVQLADCTVTSCTPRRPDWIYAERGKFHFD